MHSLFRIVGVQIRYSVGSSYRLVALMQVTSIFCFHLVWTLLAIRFTSSMTWTSTVTATFTSPILRITSSERISSRRCLMDVALGGWSLFVTELYKLSLSLLCGIGNIWSIRTVIDLQVSFFYWSIYEKAEEKLVNFNRIMDVLWFGMAPAKFFDRFCAYYLNMCVQNIYS